MPGEHGMAIHRVEKHIVNVVSDLTAIRQSEEAWLAVHVMPIAITIVCHCNNATRTTIAIGKTMGRINKK